MADRYVFVNLTGKMSEAWPSIPEFYAGRSLLITGATGFMGKALVEKLLRSCPELRIIYVLLRTKKGTEPEQRLRQLTEQPLFDRLRAENPEAFKKLRAISGDVKKLGLGLRHEDRVELQSEVSVVFHSAASVRFDDPLRDAILINVRGTREVLELALGMRQLVALLHLSTAYCNCDQPEVNERLYLAPGDWKTMIRLAETESSNDHVIQCLTSKVTGTLPNTYTYAKALGEHLVNDFRSRLPVVIVRPSIVMASKIEPYLGWVDNFQGPAGIWAGVYTGVLGITLTDGDICLDFVPVDVAIRSLICIAWQRAQQTPRASDAVAVYNCCSMTESVTQSEFIETSLNLTKQVPTMKSVWYPATKSTTSWPYFAFNLLAFHFLPGYLADLAIEMKGGKPMFAKLYRRIYVGTRAIKIFSTRAYHFTNDRFLDLGRFVQPADRAEFDFTEVVSKEKTYSVETLIGVRTFLLDDPISTLPAAKERQRRLYWLDRGMKGTFWLALVWVAVTYTPAHAAFTTCLPTAALGW